MDRVEEMRRSARVGEPIASIARHVGVSEPTVRERGERPANLPLREDGTHDFHAAEPGLLCVTDVTEFRLDGFKAYLSAAVDCFDGWPVCWRVSLHPDTGLALGTLGDLVAAVRPTEGGRWPCTATGARCK